MSALDDRTTELLARPSLEGLAFALRNLDRVRPDWKWCWSTHCAMHLAHSLWPDEIRFGGSHDVAAALKIPQRDAGALFLNIHAKPWWKFSRTLVAVGPSCPSPLDIARSIDAYVASRP